MIAELLTFGWSDQQWALQDDDYATLHWHEGNSLSKPSLEDITAKQAGYDAWSQRQAAFAAGVAAGYAVDPEGFTLALGDRDRALFAQMLSLVKEALDLG